MGRLEILETVQCEKSVKILSIYAGMDFFTRKVARCDNVENNGSEEKLGEGERERKKASMYEINVFVPPAHPSTATTDIRLV